MEKQVQKRVEVNGQNKDKEGTTDEESDWKILEFVANTTMIFTDISRKV